jgi:hypothetical protein
MIKINFGKKVKNALIIGVFATVPLGVVTLTGSSAYGSAPGCNFAHDHQIFTGAPSYSSYFVSDWPQGSGYSRSRNMTVPSTTYWNYWGTLTGC